MTDKLDTSLARLRRAVEDRQRRRRMPSDRTAEAQTPTQVPVQVTSQGTPSVHENEIAPHRRESEVNSSWADLLRRLIGR